MKKLLALCVLALVAAACDKLPAKPVSFNSVDLTGADYAKDFALTDHTGKPRTLADYRGKVVYLFFGFTQCPDICPTTMAKMAQVRKLLGKDGADLQVLFVTLDPERDTQELLSQYVPAFDPSFVGLRGDLAATAKTAREFKIFYSKAPGSTPGSYSIDHMAPGFVFDRSGKVRLYVRDDRSAEQIAQDIRLLLD